MISRRALLGGTLAAVLPRALGAQDSLVTQDSLTADRLRDPGAIGRPRDALTEWDNDPVIIAIERRLRCTCGCTLDIYTCRTTDFTCTFSPALHKEVIAMRQAGQEPEEIIAAFVAREGEAILMAPPAEGFNVAGYVVPGLVMLTAALGLAAWVSRRRVAVAGAEGAQASTAATEPAAIGDAERERLRRALDEVNS